MLFRQFLLRNALMTGEDSRKHTHKLSGDEIADARQLLHLVIVFHTTIKRNFIVFHTLVSSHASLIQSIDCLILTCLPQSLLSLSLSLSCFPRSSESICL